MKFARLLHRTQRQAALTFAPGDAGEMLSAWFPATATLSPTLRSEYTLAAGPVVTGPLRSRTMEQLALIGVSGETMGVSLSRPLPYVPDKQQTTFLVGITRATAVRCRIIEMRSVGTLYEFDAEKIEHPLDAEPDPPSGLRDRSYLLFVISPSSCTSP